MSRELLGEIETLLEEAVKDFGPLVLSKVLADMGKKRDDELTEADIDYIILKTTDKGIFDEKKKMVFRLKMKKAAWRVYKKDSDEEVLPPVLNPWKI